MHNVPTETLQMVINYIKTNGTGSVQLLQVVKLINDLEECLKTDTTQQKPTEKPKQ